MRITTRLRIITSVTIVAIVVLVPVLVWSLIQFKSANNDYAIAETIKDNFFERSSYRDQYFLYREERVRLQWDMSKDSAIDLLDQADIQFQNEADRQELKRLRGNLEDSAAIFRRIVDNTAVMDAATGNRHVYEELDKRLFSQLLMKASAVRDSTTMLMDESARRVKLTYQRLTIIIGLFGGGLALITLLTSVQLVRLIRRRLEPLHHGAEIVASGKLDHLIPVEGTDEFSELSISINAMVYRLNAEISTRKQHEEILRIREQQLADAQSLAKLGSWKVVFGEDESKDVWTVSNELNKLYEYSDSTDLVTRSGFDTMPAEDRVLTRRLWESAKRGEGPSEWDHRIVVNGKTKWIHVSANFIFDAEGRPVEASGTNQDITERKQAEIALRESEARLRTIIENEPECIKVVDREGRLTQMNAAGLAMIEADSEEQVIGRSVLSVIAPEYRKAFAEMHEQVIAGKAMQLEFEVIGIKGGHRWLETHAVPMQDKGQTVHLAVTRDITERKKSEEKLQLAANVFTHAREGILITSADGSILDVNDTFTRITGYKWDEVVGRNPRILNSGLQGQEFYTVMWRELTENGHWNGEVWNRRKNGEVYAELLTISAVRDVHGNVKQYVGLFSDITPFKEHERKLEHIAHYDALTSLPNRVLLADRLHQGMTQALRRGQHLAVAYLDLDGFKVINDNYGHETGDQLLMAVAQNMKHVLREGDTLARLGGDEFVAVLMDLEDVTASVPMLTRLLASASQQVQIGTLELQVSASLGVTIYPQREDVDADQLLRQADQAMYQAKLAGKNRFHVFDADQDISIRGHHESVARIRRALSDGELVLYYQPKVNMRTGKIIGAEALIRWQHPEKGLLQPSLFLPVIEGHVLAMEVGEWVIDSALAQMESWHASGLDIPVSVNVGARQLQHPDFVARLSGILARHPEVRPSCIELEVLETSALEDLARASQVIEECRKIGVMFALDDFGTGYSSLTYLKRLPVAMLKIDQSFVRGMLDDSDDLAILEGVLGLANAFRRQVIAEGVESIEHGSMLLQLGCELAQGYGIAHPMPADELPNWATTWKPDPTWANMRAVSHEDVSLLHAAVEHTAWVDAIAKYLKGEIEAPPPLDQHQCAFGQWLDSKGQKRHGSRPAFKSIEQLHRQVHSLAGELLQRSSPRLDSDGQAISEQLLVLRDELLGHLKSLLQDETLH